MALPGHLAWRDVLTGRRMAEQERMPVSEMLADLSGFRFARIAA